MSALRTRGRPVASLAVLLLGWVTVRAVVWEPPFASREAASPQARRAHPTAAQRTFVAAIAGLPSTKGSAVAPNDAVVVRFSPTPGTAQRIGNVVHARQRSRGNAPPAANIAEPAAARPALAGLPPLLDRAGLQPSQVRIASAPTRSGWPTRWSGDAWVLYRSGGGEPAASGAAAAYGGSQAGSVIRFALAPGDDRSPHAYFRGTRALRGPTQAEAAFGLSARPIAALPLRVMAEARITDRPGGVRARPAVLAVSEFPPLMLPLRTEGEIYAAGGYVGGGDATPFFDAQATVERRLVQTGPADLRLGAGAWSGGQRGAARLDVGPRATVRLDGGIARSRLAFDWRFRVAGAARPGSGPAVTFSAGF